MMQSDPRSQLKKRKRKSEKNVDSLVPLGQGKHHHSKLLAIGEHYEYLSISFVSLLLTYPMFLFFAGSMHVSFNKRSYIWRKIGKELMRYDCQSLWWIVIMTISLKYCLISTRVNGTPLTMPVTRRWLTVECCYCQSVMSGLIRYVLVLNPIGIVPPFNSWSPATVPYQQCRRTLLSTRSLGIWCRQPTNTVLCVVPLQNFRPCIYCISSISGSYFTWIMSEILMYIGTLFS